MLNELTTLIGPIPTNETSFKRKLRFHQGWWRALILAEEAGCHPLRNSETICSAISGGEASGKNFLSPAIVKIVHETVDQRNERESGMINKDRLFNNLLSSQPLCFNFFGELKGDMAFALAVLNGLGFELTAVEDILFEYAPPENYTTDNSAFDVAMRVRRGDKTGLIGLECKYTDSFSSTEYDKPAYRSIFEQSMAFKTDYDNCKSAKYNQLFRNQLIAEALALHEKYDFVITGLFCHKDDVAVETGREFQCLLTGREESFRVITYHAFIEAMQRSDATWQQRELSMMLWARYCATQLSERIYKQVCK